MLSTSNEQLRLVYSLKQKLRNILLFRFHFKAKTHIVQTIEEYETQSIIYTIQNWKFKLIIIAFIIEVIMSKISIRTNDWKN